MRACQLLLFSSSVSCCHGEQCASYREEGWRERVRLGSEPAAFVLECSSVDRPTWLENDLISSKYGSNPGNNNIITRRSCMDGTNFITLDLLGCKLKKVLIALFRWRWNFVYELILCEYRAVLADLKSYCSLFLSLGSSEPTNRNLAQIHSALFKVHSSPLSQSTERH